MSWRKGNPAIVVLLMTSMRLFGQEAELRQDQQAYCEYVSQQAQAQRDLLRTPSAATCRCSSPTWSASPRCPRRGIPKRCATF